MTLKASFSSFKQSYKIKEVRVLLMETERYNCLSNFSAVLANKVKAEAKLKEKAKKREISTLNLPKYNLTQCIKIYNF